MMQKGGNNNCQIIGVMHDTQWNMEITQTMPHKETVFNLIWVERLTLDFGSGVKEANWKERGRFNDKMLSQAVISSATLFATKSRKFTFIICYKKENGAEGAETTVNNTWCPQHWVIKNCDRGGQSQKVSGESARQNYSPNSKEKDGDTLSNEIQQDIMKDIQFCLDHKDRKNVTTGRENLVEKAI